jgi:hypothetical protein
MGDLKQLVLPGNRPRLRQYLRMKIGLRLVLADELCGLRFAFDLCGEFCDFNCETVQFVHFWVFVSSANLKDWCDGPICAAGYD